MFSVLCSGHMAYPHAHYPSRHWVKGAARVCLLKQSVSIFKSSKDKEDKVLYTLALNSFILVLRELKRSCALAFQMLKVLSEEHESSADLWNHKELLREDCSTHGEVLSVICFKDKIFSGHSDGTINVQMTQNEVKGLRMDEQNLNTPEFLRLLFFVILVAIPQFVSSYLDRRGIAL